MKLKNLFFIVFLITICSLSCRPDETDINQIPPRDRTEQQITDNDSIIGYLQTHYYNSALFENGGNYSISDIVISELPTDENGNYQDLPNPEENTLLIDDVETLTTNFEDADYEFYILRINQGGGETPNFTDNVKIRYSGNLLDEVVFDTNVNADDPLDMTAVIRGWVQVIPTFSAAESGPFINDDGTLAYDNYGLGVMFIPSGLAYFNQGRTGIPAYSNLIFKFELYDTSVFDHDGDGVLSHLEDLNDNMNVFDDDTDGDLAPNYFDNDDDGDGVFSIFEDIDGDGDPSNDDTNGDGIPNYLDPESTESNLDDDDA
ncbi:MAG: FKBP-type peptidyl-prolyl cis-trans isomerase [Bacteroidota bacterium]